MATGSSVFADRADALALALLRADPAADGGQQVVAVITS